MKQPRLLFAAVATMFLFSCIAFAQELPTATKHMNVKWYQVTYFKFKPDKVNDALKIIYDHFVPADKAAGRDIINFDFRSGSWHHVAYFPLEGGAIGIEWKIAPNDEKWWASLAKLVGGAQKAQELVKKWSEMLADQKSEIVMRRM